MNRNIYIDCTQLIFNQLNTGIQRVERNVLKHASSVQKKLNINVQPVLYFRGNFYRINSNNVHSYLLNVVLHTFKPNRFRLLAISAFPRLRGLISSHWKGFNKGLLFFPLVVTMLPIIIWAYLFILTGRFEKIRLQKNDVYFILGSWWHKDFDLSSIRCMKQVGCLFTVLIHDIIPITHREFVKMEHVQAFEKNFGLICELADLIVTNSAYTTKELNFCLERLDIKSKTVKNFRLGFDLDLIISGKVRNNLKKTFFELQPYISVGSIDPRKNYQFLLDVFDQLWSQDKNVSLCIIGKYGWKSEDLIGRIKSHYKYNVNLFWFDDLQDAELEFCYKNAKALIYPSIIEGFGLPLVEALSYGCSVMASDIPVFHEIGGEICTYFSLNSIEQLHGLILQFEAAGKLLNVTKSEFKWSDWQESTEKLFEIIIENLAFA